MILEKNKNACQVHVSSQDTSSMADFSRGGGARIQGEASTVLPDRGLQGAASPPTCRLAKYLADRNLCSRREAERHILNGDVVVNGAKVLTPVFFVNDQDSITFCGRNVAERPTEKLWIYHKRVGEITTHRDPQQRKTVFDAVAEQYGLSNVLSVGRLDINSEGLLLLTNSNRIAHELETTHAERVYKVRVFGQMHKLLSSPWVRNVPSVSSENGTGSFANIELRDVTIDDVKYAPIYVRFSHELSAKRGSQNFWLHISLREGKNREIRRVMGALGFQVSRLIRINYGRFELGDLAVGGLRDVRGGLDDCFQMWYNCR
jgi:23S rRNA pseudouridine2605 synthase